MVPDRLSYGIYRLCCSGMSILMYRPSRSSVISGVLQAGGNVDWSALLNPQKVTLYSLCTLS
jgi:hypothetical protein